MGGSTTATLWYWWSDLEPGMMMYFPFLNEERFRTPEDFQNHRVDQLGDQKVLNWIKKYWIELTYCFLIPAYDTGWAMKKIGCLG